MRISDWSSDVCSSDLNAGTNVGVILTALFVPWIILTWGWEYSFIITGIIGFLLLFFWLKIYKRPEEHEKITKEELDLINSDAERSEEHTSELQSLMRISYAVFCLKKNNIDNQQIPKSKQPPK